jgi:PAS domain-containing protein
VISENKSFLLQESEIEVLEKKGEVKLVGAKPKSWLGVPLRLENQVIGLIVIQSYDEKIIYNSEDLHLLEFLSTQIATAIDRVQTRESIRKLFTAVEQSPVLVVITDKNGSIEYINPMVTTVTGFSADEVTGRNPTSRTCDRAN